MLGKLSSPFTQFMQLTRALLPQTRCALCASACNSAQAVLCHACRAAVFTEGLRCVQCAVALPSSAATARCGNCISTQPAYDATLCATDYSAEVRGLVLDFKFNRQPGLARWFARELAPLCESSSANALLVPVPLSKERLAERGYNQSWEIAKQLSRITQRITRVDALLRTRHTPAQSTLPLGKRQASVKGAFACPARMDDVQEVLLVDDVMTSGATLQECAATLKRAGVKRVVNVVMFRAQLD